LKFVQQNFSCLVNTFANDFLSCFALFLLRKVVYFVS